MKKLFLATALGSIHYISFAQHTLEKIWQTDTTFKRPESVLYDAATNILYVSNMGLTQKQGEGSISKLTLDGKTIINKWVTEMTATKGLGIYKNRLYAAEQGTVAVINIKTGIVEKRIIIEGAVSLNDITIDKYGIIYVSDSRGDKIYKIDNGTASVFLENMKKVNGVLAVDKDLYALTDGSLQKIDSSGKQTILVEGIGPGTDGIVQINKHEFLVTCNTGVIYVINDDGSKELLMDTRDQKISTNDLGYDPIHKMLYVPSVSKNYVIAYKLN